MATAGTTLEHKQKKKPAKGRPPVPIEEPRETSHKKVKTWWSQHSCQKKVSGSIVTKVPS